MPTVKVNINGINELDFPTGVSSATVNAGVATVNLTGGGGSVTGSGTTGHVPVWTDSTVLGDSHIDDGVTVAGSLTASESLIGIGAGWFTNTLGSQIQAQFPFSTGLSSVNVADAGQAYVSAWATAGASPTASYGAVEFGATTDGTPAGTSALVVTINSNGNEIPFTIGNGLQIFVQPEVSADYPSAMGFVGINNPSPSYQLDVIGDINTSTVYRVGGNIVIPSTTTGYHGTGTGDVKVQLSDGTGAPGHIAAYDANGGLTDGGSPSGSGTVTSVSLTVPARQTVAGSPVTTSGTLAITDNTQNANLVFAGPSTGPAAAPTFRSTVTADLPASSIIRPLGITIDGGGSPPTTGVKGYLTIPFGCTIKGWTIIADQVGSANVEVWYIAGSGAPPTAPNIPTSGNKISASAPVALSSVQSAAGGATAVSTWTSSLAQWGTLAFNLASVTTCTRISVQLQVQLS
jgi:hypothetical protein